ncbi:hypothetical protein B0H34DRAFT_737033 [Crassisporium funariophilum]|nr:hypothetical protein B0H34DRAFT_737033 [Crassisporium funariophilum]
MESPSFDAHGTLGALSVGVLISCFLFGIVTVQTYIYYSRFPDDQPKWKYLVAFVWILELAHCISICHSLYILTISNYGHPEALVKPPVSLFLAIILSGVLAFVVQGFFAERVRIVSGKRLIPIICWVLVGIQYIMHLVAAAEAFKMTTLAEYEKEWKWLISSMLAVGAAVDLIIAAVLCYYLKQQKLNCHAKTAIMVDKIIAWTIQTGVITSFSGVIMLICYLAMPENLVWLSFFMFFARMFSNSLLASCALFNRIFPATLTVIVHSLNTRIFLRGGAHVDVQSEMGSNLYNGGNNYATRSQPTQVSVHMTRLTEVTIDSKVYPRDLI